MEHHAFSVDACGTDASLATAVAHDALPSEASRVDAALQARRLDEVSFRAWPDAS